MPREGKVTSGVRRVSPEGKKRESVAGVEAPPAGAHLGLGEAVLRVQRDRTRGGEVSILRLVRALVHSDVVDDLGDEPMEIRVSLPVRVRHHVDGNVVYGDGDVRSVVGVEAA